MYPFHQKFSSDRCIRKYSSLDGKVKVIKPLKKMVRKLRGNGYTASKHNVIVVDDTPSTFCQNYGNAVQVDRFYGDQDDVELMIAKDTIIGKLDSYVKNGSVRN